jgi:3-(3-hydroxy-phenyl)propionate hydroxylase
MHQPHAEPRRSIYYRYQVHAPWLASAHPPQDRKKVVIVGAGPIGLFAALELARLGVPCVLLESELQVSEGSRAIVFTRRSMEILQQVGVDAPITANGLPWRFGNSFYRGQRVYRMEAPHDPDDRFFPMINLQQQYLEQYLTEAVLAHPLIEMRWGNRVTRVDPKDSFVRVEVDTPEGPYTLESDWLVAADGARSGIRAMMDLKLEGASYEGRFVIADIRIDLPLPTERLAFFDPDWNPGNTILMHREPHGIWRVDYQLPADETPEQALAPESLKARIDAQLAMIGHGGTPWEMDWCSVYSARALTLPDYVHGRVLFTGDAAHMLPIFGVRGANTGWQDAQCLAWRLAFVARGVAPESLLQSYSSERVAAAWEIIDEAGKSTRFMTPPTRGFRLLRDAVLSLS